eukprot:TRINITY_DN10583_c0_g1_i3.p1 TRINITY_DN10583_c0_g1~~TRINITY_DN10583_c0_g1_i3.p1  ORF type:complete len:419 (-),score=71.58 TRINITY_DN10583_c0_g1_i3:47-1303(-)
MASDVVTEMDGIRTPSMRRAHSLRPYSVRHGPTVTHCSSTEEVAALILALQQPPLPDAATDPLAIAAQQAHRCGQQVQLLFGKGSLREVIYSMRKDFDRKPDSKLLGAVERLNVAWAWLRHYSVEKMDGLMADLVEFRASASRRPVDSHDAHAKTFPTQLDHLQVKPVDSGDNDLSTGSTPSTSLCDGSESGEASLTEFDGHGEQASSEECEELEDLPQADKELDPYLGAHVKKMIGDQLFHGQVEDIEVEVVTKERLYRIKYNDGDLEHFTADQVEQFKECSAKENINDASYVAGPRHLSSQRSLPDTVAVEVVGSFASDAGFRGSGLPDTGFCSGFDGHAPVITDPYYVADPRHLGMQRGLPDAVAMKIVSSFSSDPGFRGRGKVRGSWSAALPGRWRRRSATAPRQVLLSPRGQM